MEQLKPVDVVIVGGGWTSLTSVALTYRAADGLIDRYLRKPGALA